MNVYIVITDYKNKPSKVEGVFTEKAQAEKLAEMLQNFNAYKVYNEFGGLVDTVSLTGTNTYVLKQKIKQ